MAFDFYLELESDIKSHIIFLILIFSNVTFAYNGSKCWDGMMEHGYVSVPYFTIGTSTSLGNCALIDSWKVDIGKVFLFQNEESIKKDIVRGEGEYLSSLVEVLQIKNTNISEFKKTLKANYENIFSLGDFESRFKRITEIAKTEKI